MVALGHGAAKGLGGGAAETTRLPEAEQLALLEREAPELFGLLGATKERLDELSLYGLALDEAHGLQAEAVS